VAETFGERALAVVLTGMGKDSLRGCEQIQQAGGQILAQDQPTSVIWGMPGNVAQAGLADKVLPLEQIAAEIGRRVRFGRHSTPAS
jgi:two-component system chemotaxis response regulator CheB